MVANALSKMTLAEAHAVMEENDVPVAPVLDRPQMLELDHFRRPGTVLTDNRTGRGQAAMGHPARYAVHPARELAPVPGLGDDPTRRWTAR